MEKTPCPKNYHLSELKEIESFLNYKKYYLIKENTLYKIIIAKSYNYIFIQCNNYMIYFTKNEFSILTKTEFRDIDKPFEFIINLFENHQVYIKYIKKFSEIIIILKNKKEIEITLNYNNINNDLFQELINKYKEEKIINNTLKKYNIYIKEIDNLKNEIAILKDIYLNLIDHKNNNITTVNNNINNENKSIEKEYKKDEKRKTNESKPKDLFEKVNIEEKKEILSPNLNEFEGNQIMEFKRNILLNKNENIDNKNCNESKMIDFIINIIIYNEEIKIKMKKSIKENFQNNNNLKEKIYFIKKNIIDEYLKEIDLFEIYNNLKNNLEEIFPEKINTEEKKILLKKKYEKIKYDYQNDSKPISLRTNLGSVYNNIKEIYKEDYIIVKNHKEKIYYHDNFYLLNRETIGLINANFKKYLFIYDCLIGDRKIFVFNISKSKSFIEVGTFNNFFQIELIRDIFNFYEQEENKIFQYGYDKYYKTSFFFTKYDSLSISPLFDSNNNLNGYCYLFVKNPFDNKKFNDYSDLIYNDILIKIIYLIINNLKKKESSFYYLIKEKWFNIFKEKFFYEKTKNDINNNNIAKSYLKNFIDEENNISKEKDNIPFLKEIIFLINNIPQTNKFYNDNQERMISDEFQIEEPDLEAYKNDIENYQFTIYNHFILIEKKIFEQIYYEKNLESKRNYCSCFYEEDLMFIKLNKQIT